MKKRCMLAVTSLAVGFAASLAAPSAHAAGMGDGITPHLQGNHLLPLPLVTQLVDSLKQHPAADQQAPAGPTTSTTGTMLPGLLGGGS
jgi:hypothetical protein